MLVEELVDPPLRQALAREHEFGGRLEPLLVDRGLALGERAEHGSHRVAHARHAAHGLQDHGRVVRHLLPKMLGPAGFLLQVPFDRGPDAHRVQQEGVVAEVRVELVVHHALVARGAQGVGDLLLLPHRKQHVELHADHERRLHGRGQAGLQARPAVRPGLLHREAVHRFGDPQHRVGVVVVDPLLALVAQVFLDLEFVIKAFVRLAARAREAVLAEALLPLLPRPVGDRADLPGQAQPPRGQLAVVVIAVVPRRVPHDRRALGVAEGHAARKAFGARGDRHELADAQRVPGRGAEALHASQGGADARVQLLDA
mmetsp:Transcript_52111/g.158276  ORF Transcript_52111/g.158276 Transcript_52111/m.158276 type:complete len:314 (-) Transcript_52111:462-1403(-)